MTPAHRLEVLPDAAAAARRGAELIAEAAAAAIDDSGRFTLAASGGTEPWRMYGLLVEQNIDWERTEVFQVDERVVSDDDPDRNLKHLLESLPDEGRSRVVGMPVTADDLESAAAEYAQRLPEALDLIHLGLGPDGHTASLVPGDPVLEVKNRRVALTAGEYQGHRRITLTFAELARARSAFWLVTGAEKRDALGWLLAGDVSVPAGRVELRDSLVIADRAASSR